MSTATGTDVVKQKGRTLVGRVVSAENDKTITVEVTRLVKHRRYHKYVSQTRNFRAHDEVNACKAGDTVVIRESRPLSKSKRWVVTERRA